MFLTILLSLSSLIVLAVVAFAVVDIARVRKLRSIVAEKLPEPPGRVPILGHLQSSNLHAEYDRMFESAKAKNKIIIQVGFDITVLISDPEDIRRILASDNLPKAALYKNVGAALGSSVLTAPHHTPLNPWKRQRSILNASFRLPLIHTLCQTVFRDHAHKLADGLGSMEGSVVNFQELITQVTLNIVSEAGFGHSLEGSPPFVESIVNCINCLSSVLMMMPGTWGGSLLRVINRKSFAIAHQTIDKVIQNKIAQRKRDSSLNIPGKYTDILDVLLAEADANEGSLSLEEIRGQVMVFFLAGSDTTSNLLSWLMFELLKNPNAYAKLVAEIDSLPSELTPDHLLRGMPYTDMCINEALRLHSPVISITRTTGDSTYTLSDGTVLPPGVNLECSFYLMQRDPAIWGPDALKFVPERHAAGAKDRPPFSLAPFSMGPRICIGKTFALYEAKVILHALFSKLRFELSDEKDNGVGYSGTGLLKPNKISLIPYRR